MNVLTDEQQKLPLWRIFFMFSGFMSLLYWNIILNLVLYFSVYIGESFFEFVTFAYSIGNILSFLTGRLVFKKLTMRQAIVANIFSASIIFFTLLFLFLYITSTGIAWKVTIILMVGLYSYFNGYYQGTVSGFASICGPISISSFTIGTGVSGFGSNIFAIIFTFIFPTHNEDTQKNELRKQMIAYFIFLIIIFLCYVTVTYLFVKKHGHFMISDEGESGNQSIENPEQKVTSISEFKESDLLTVKTGKTYGTWKTLGSERKYSSMSIIKRVLDVWFAMIFTYYITIQIVTFMIPNLANKYDNNGEMYMLTYFLLYNMGDTCGKIFPNSWNFKNSFRMHLFTFLRGMIQIYFLILIYTQPPLFFSHYVFRGAIFLLIGISNGYLTNNFFCLSAMRFSNTRNKDVTGFFMIFALIIGVTFGTLSGVLWNL